MPHVEEVKDDKDEEKKKAAAAAAAAAKRTELVNKIASGIMDQFPADADVDKPEEAPEAFHLLHAVYRRGLEIVEERKEAAAKKRAEAKAKADAEKKKQ